ncbi:malonyl-CoA decarboxylase-domain-containing protein [Glomus cerebriforme]|uniref:Malonyl-CoA decarboxylase-domain-containing protein n=1 Tax=Glomus cerebriforme TaxID=658196 RepID=A0A397T2P4_9GLOM|nr:malonyl-CoA decarboxylase-domain-containing protein [Glomus cerebriforme]
MSVFSCIRSLIYPDKNYSKVIQRFQKITTIHNIQSYNIKSTIIQNIMKHNRKFSSFDHDFPQKKIPHSEAQKSFEQYFRQSLKSDAIEDFWQNIENYTHEPGFFSFSGPNSKLAISEPKFINKLISASVAEKRNEGDLVPTIMAKKCCELYENLDKEDKIKFLKILAHDFGVTRDKVFKATDHYIGLSNSNASERAILRAEQILRHAMIPVHNVFFDRINRLPSGPKFLVDMRADLLEYLKEHGHDAFLTSLNESLKEKLASLLVGFLNLKRLTWHSSAASLEKVIQYEAVHAIKDWDDMKRRVGPGRRLFAFFYKDIGHEPLVFIQVALTKEIVNNVQTILEDPNPTKSIPVVEDIHCAIFYSITSQQGLSGIDLGNFLIKRVVRELQNEFPSIKTFSTLSPIPKFKNWLINAINVEGDSMLINDEPEKIKKLGGNLDGNGTETLKEIIKSKDWVRDENCFYELKPILMRLCARYILTEKRRTLALDPVANFHIRNGACVYRLNWLGDISNKGLEESFGIMANYNYILDHIESNNKQYLCDGTIAISNNDPVLVEEAKRTSNIKIIKIIED